MSKTKIRCPSCGHRLRDLERERDARDDMARIDPDDLKTLLGWAADVHRYATTGDPRAIPREADEVAELLARYGVEVAV